MTLGHQVSLCPCPRTAAQHQFRFVPASILPLTHSQASGRGWRPGFSLRVRELQGGGNDLPPARGGAVPTAVRDPRASLHKGPGAENGQSETRASDAMPLGGGPSSTESLRQLSQKLNGLVSEVAMATRPSAGGGWSICLRETEAALCAEGRGWAAGALARHCALWVRWEPVSERPLPGPGSRMGAAGCGGG